jgi:hypothetical protein
VLQFQQVFDDAGEAAAQLAAMGTTQALDLLGEIQPVERQI